MRKNGTFKYHDNNNIYYYYTIVELCCIIFGIRVLFCYFIMHTRNSTHVSDLQKKKKACRRKNIPS